MTHLTFDVVHTPIGGLILVYEGDALVHADFEDNATRRKTQLTKRYGEYAYEERATPHAIVERFQRYFEGDAKALDELERDVVLSPGGSDVQRRVWTALRTIPTGTTMSYGGLATRIGLPGAARAVGAINGQNPLSVIVPCHRVIGASGALTGYAGGLERKRWLLIHERALGTEVARQ
ncbi:Methylated-DNA--protein-cysteine methyltransferase [Labilithrix luteola]|uniref:Methylated-DNA--protein-cysteine methyltransferase n=1 Tax=Labilithrix luteola TaxID=1391654 RepID=A0A0K1PTU9_9BACT|nr:methylated-DNA--[protein]-cysteine S-methyltransferase [Labilithrix luteola]AKU96968.1 Methylated-DNA--protein-cysteine methyltransferase [Labilithrix luteola]